MALLFSSPEIACRGIAIGELSKINPKNSKRNSFRCISEQKVGKRRVCAAGFVARIADCEDTVSDPVQSDGFSRYFTAPVQRGSSYSKQKGDGDDKQDYYLNMGYAIRTLREEFPYIFFREPSFDIYRDDIAFKDPLYTFAGIENYKSIFWSLRFYGRIFFKALSVDIVSVWQPVESVIMIRFTIHAIPRVLWERHGRFDGISTYKLDRNGKIFEHRVDNIALNSPPKFHVLSVEELVLSIDCPSTPKPTYFEFVSALVTGSQYLIR